MYFKGIILKEELKCSFIPFQQYIHILKIVLFSSFLFARVLPLAYVMVALMHKNSVHKLYVNQL